MKTREYLCIWSLASDLFIIACFKSVIYMLCSALGYMMNHFFPLSLLPVYSSCSACSWVLWMGLFHIIKILFSISIYAVWLLIFCLLRHLTVVCRSRYANPSLVSWCNSSCTFTEMYLLNVLMMLLIKWWCTLVEIKVCSKLVKHWIGSVLVVSNNILNWL